METEIEAKFLRIDIEQLVMKLKGLRAKEVLPQRVMKRKNYDFSDKRLKQHGGWIRLREDNHVVMLAFKQQRNSGVHGMKEVELVVDDFAKAEAFLASIGVVEKAYQESKRWSWELDGVQVEIDEWPWCPPFVEIEGVSEEAIKAVAQKLAFDWEKARFGAADVVYLDTFAITDDDFHNVETMTFNMSHPTHWQRRY